jgi:hypothetical protein
MRSFGNILFSIGWGMAIGVLFTVNDGHVLAVVSGIALAVVGLTVRFWR